MPALATSRLPALLIAPVLIALAAMRPPHAAAQDPEVGARETIVVVPDPRPLRLTEPMTRTETRETATGLVVAAGVCLTLAIPALGAVASQVPTFDDRMPESAMATLGTSAILGPFGVLALGIGLDYAAGGDGRSGLFAASIAEVVISVLLGVLAVAVAPGIGAPWASAQEQVRVAELLGVQAFAFGLSGSLALTAAFVPGPQPGAGSDITPRSPDERLR